VFTVSDDLDIYGASTGMMRAGVDVRLLGRSAAGRRLLRVQEAGLVRAVQVDVEAKLADIKLGAAAGLGRTAQTEVALLSQMEADLIAVCGTPLAAKRIDMMASIAATQMAEVLADGINSFRRI